MSSYIPPWVIAVNVSKPGVRRVRLWLPLFLLWPLLLLAVVLVLAGTLMADLVLLISGARYHHYTLLVISTLALLGAARGTHVRASDHGNHVNVDIY